MRYALVLAAVLLLAGCKSEEQKKAEFIKFCSENEFSLKQCEVLYMIAKASSDASDNAAASSMASSLAIGIAAGSAGARR